MRAPLRWIAIITIVFGHLFLFVACSKELPETKSPSLDNLATDKELEEVELLWHYPAFGSQADQQLVQDEINKITKAKINATVKLLPSDIDQYTQKMNTVVAANDVFDIAWTGNWNFSYADNTAKGAFVALDDLLEQYAPDLKKSIPDFVWEATRINGQIYGIPNYQTVTSKEGFMIQKKLIDKYNLDIHSIKEFADIDPVLATIKAGEPDMIPITIYKKGPNFENVKFAYNIEGIAQLGGVYHDRDDLQVFNLYESPEFRQYVELVRSWNQKGYFIEDAALTKSLPNQNKGIYGVVFHNVLKPGAELETKHTYGTEYVSVPLTEPYITTASITTTLNAISSTSKHPERAMMFLYLMNTDKQLYNMIVYGLEGKHYTKNADGTITRLGKSSGYETNMDWVFGNTFNGLIVEGKSQAILDQTIHENESALHLKANGFHFSPDSVTAELANINAVFDQYKPLLYTGSVDPSTHLPEFLEKLRRAGSDEVISEMQKQLDVWKINQK